MKDAIREGLEEHRRVAESLAAAMAESIERAAGMILDTYRRGGKVLIMGNGGSAADAQHFAAELVGRYRRERRALPAIALTTDTSILTSVSNDYGYADVFKRQVEAHAGPGDLVVGISTSGKSESVLAALRKAREMNLYSTGMTGRSGHALAALTTHCVMVDSDDTPRIQEAHILAGHIICELVERELFP